MNRGITNVITAGAGVMTLLLVICWPLTAACGQENAAAVARPELAVITNVSCRHEGGGDVVTVTADRPLVFSSYRLTKPPRALVDLAQTDPGTVASPIVCGGTQVTQLRLSRHELASGVLTRLELLLADGAEYTAALAPGDKRQLILTFTGVPRSPAAQAAAAAAPKGESAAVGQPAAGGAGMATAAPAAGESEPHLREIVVVPAGVDLVTDGAVASFTTFPLTNPDRFVLDLPGLRSGLSADPVPVNAFGIGSARVAELPGKSRVVFEGEGSGIRQLKVTRTGRGLRLLASAPAGVPAREGAATPPAIPAKERDPSLSAVQSLDFGVVEGGSRVTMTVGGSCVASQPVRNAEGISFVVKKCVLPRHLRRTLDTNAFPSVVRAVVPYQVTVKGGAETRLLVKLDQPAEYLFRQDGGTIVLDISHPKLEEAAPKGGASPAPLPAPAGPAPQPQPQAQPQPQPGPAPTPAEATIRKLQDSVAAPAGTKKLYSGRKVTLEFVDADIRKIFQLIAEVSNLNILIGDDVSGTITIKLVNVPWDQALDMILESKGLGMRAEGNIVLVKPKSKFKSADEESLEAKKSREKMMDLHTRVFDVNFASAGEVVTHFRTLGSGRSDASITQDERTNKVIVTDIEQAVDRMKKFLESIDIPEKQVLIEARIVQADDTFSQDMGVHWGVQYKDASASFLGMQSLDTEFGGKVSPLATVAPTAEWRPGMGTGITFGSLTSSINVDLRLSAAASIDRVKIISSPKVATLNNKPAKIAQGQMIPYQNTTATTGAVTQFVEAALTLEVTPHITPDGSVIMKIKASNNSSTGIGNPPAINKKEATTELLVRSGETTVIGGIYVDNDSDGYEGVPYLMDIPVIGWLFKSNTKRKLRNELLIFITPRVIS